MNKKSKKNETFTVKEVVILLVITCMANATIFFFMNIGEKESSLSYNDTVKEILESYNYIKDNYYGDIDEKDLINGAIKGMTEALGDNYSSFIDDNQSDTYDVLLVGEYTGVGIQISQLIGGNEIVISAVFDNSPALKAGLEVGDVVKSINGISTDGMNTSDIGDYIKNGNITNFDIVVTRNGEEKSFKVERGPIVIDSVTSEMFEREGKKIGYIRIDVFALNTDEQFEENLKKLESEGMNSLIIDVRGNTGGHLSSVTNIISEFLDSSKIIYRTSTKTKEEIKYSKGNTAKEYEIILLVDGQSASASEVLASALKESYGAKLLGTKTFGKGTVQEMQEIESTGKNYKITTKKWLTPNGNWINGIGITPDYEVELNTKYYENPIRENDNQLNEALKLLSNN
ncbi:MAG: S41 family peptidase [Firmicutes bacterium]|mgnify:CR=1 FL=1|nr:S41 family peptidase [Bacillota bacterium]